MSTKPLTRRRRNTLILSCSTLLLNAISVGNESIRNEAFQLGWQFLALKARIEAKSRDRLEGHDVAAMADLAFALLKGTP
jgi:hypothetical protein